MLRLPELWMNFVSFVNNHTQKCALLVFMYCVASGMFSTLLKGTISTIMNSG